MINIKHVTAIVEPVGTDCNLRCTYCFYHKLERESKLSKLMSYDVLEAFIKEMFAYNEKEVQFIWHGGEPTLAPIDFYEKAVELQNKYKQPNHKIRNVIQTNGTLINSDWVKFLKKNSFGIGLSVDGPKWLHNKFRPESFDLLNDTIGLLRQSDVNFGVICVVNSENVRYPLEIYEFFKLQNLKSMSIKPCIDLENNKLTNFSVDPIDYTNFMIRIFDLWMNDNNPNFMIKQFRDILLSYFNGKPRLCTNKQCACMKFITVDYDGQVYSCNDSDNNFQNQSYGNIAKSNIQLLLESENAILWRNEMLSRINKCRNCEFLKFCGGGCTKTRVYLTEEFDSRYCHSIGMLVQYICENADEILQKQLLTK